jgi:hypothetical protein
MASHEKLEVWVADPKMAMATQGRVVVAVLRAVVDLEMLRELRRQTDKVVQKLGFQRVGVTVVEPSAVGDVPKEVRAEGAALMRDFPQAASATVIEGGGFKAIASGG